LVGNLYYNNIITITKQQVVSQVFCGIAEKHYTADFSAQGPAAGLVKAAIVPVEDHPIYPYVPGS